MAIVTYDGQSFSLDGRRVWILGAAIEYARVPPEAWADRIAAARQAGFNTISTSCPWLLHEPRKGRFVFAGPTDVRRFVELCAEAGMWAILRPGPYVGGHYDAGGLPSWLVETPGVKLRQANETFLERVSLYFRKLLGELVDLQVTTGGPIILVQSEHAWLCANQAQADRYLQEVTRYIRESGIGVPIVNANDLWQEVTGTIDTWRGSEDLLVHLRQFRAVQPAAPRVVAAFEAAGPGLWGATGPQEIPPPVLLERLAQVLAAGAQPVVAPFHGGTNFGFLGGRIAGRADAFVTTSAAPGAPLREDGERGPGCALVKRLMTFARHFSYVFAELDQDYHPIALDLGVLHAAAPDAAPGSRRRASAAAGRRLSVVPLKGSAGQIAFVFADGPGGDATLLLEDGLRLPVHLGDQPVGWFVLNVDLRGAGKLDYANICPWAIVGRGILVLQGPARAQALLSINGSPLVATVPTGARPLVVDHKQVTVVICNQEQIDVTCHDDQTVYVGADGLAADGSPLVSGRSRTVWAVGTQGELREIQAGGGPAAERAATARGAGPLRLGAWESAPATDHVSGSSPRFATLDGPQTLAACGAPLGYGWYRIRIRTASAGRRRLHLPDVADRAHLYVDGKFEHLAGVGPGADHRPFEVQLARGEHLLVVLLDNLGRFSEGNDLGERKGLFGHIQQVRKLTGVRVEKAEGEAVDPFALRGYIAGRTRGQKSETTHATWTFSHTRVSPVLLDVDGAEASGTFLLNGRPLGYYAGATGGCLARYLMGRDTRSFRRGKNVVSFAPDPRQPEALEQMVRAVSLHECVETPSEGAEWAFAKWEPPPGGSFRPAARGSAGERRGVPCWWRAPFELREPVAALWVDTAGLSKGQVYVNGNNLGRYFAATATGRAAGPQLRLYVPGFWLRPGEANELLLFDEHGFPPQRVRLASK